MLKTVIHLRSFTFEPFFKSWLLFCKLVDCCHIFSCVIPSSSAPRFITWPLWNIGCPVELNWICTSTRLFTQGQLRIKYGIIIFTPFSLSVVNTELYRKNRECHILYTVYNEAAMNSCFVTYVLSSSMIIFAIHYTLYGLSQIRPLDFRMYATKAHSIYYTSLWLWSFSCIRE